MRFAVLTWFLLEHRVGGRIARQAEGDGRWHKCPRRPGLSSSASLWLCRTLAPLGRDRRQPGSGQLAIIGAGHNAKCRAKADFDATGAARSPIRVAALLLQQARQVEPRHRGRRSAAARAGRQRRGAAAAHLTIAAHRRGADGPLPSALPGRSDCSSGRCVRCNWAWCGCQRADRAVRVQQRRLLPCSGHAAAAALQSWLRGQHVGSCAQVRIHHAHDSRATRTCQDRRHACWLRGLEGTAGLCGH